MCVEFNWTLNQEIMVSTAVTGKPQRRSSFWNYMWHSCVAGAGDVWKPVTESRTWIDLISDEDETLILSPLDNSDCLNVCAGNSFVANVAETPL